MATAARILAAGDVFSRRDDGHSALDAAVRPLMSFESIQGRLVELSTQGAEVALTLGVRAVHAAQLEDEPTAWLGCRESAFFPEDVRDSGVDLDALPCVRLASADGLSRALSHLVRSGAFGLVVVDLVECPWADRSLPTPLQSRVEALCRTHGCCVLCLTRRSPEEPALGPMVSLRLHAVRVWGEGTPSLELMTLRDKRAQPAKPLRLRFASPLGVATRAHG
jgi:recombination protein RecA